MRERPSIQTYSTSKAFSTYKFYGEFNFQCIELSRALEQGEWIRRWENIIVRVLKMLQLTSL